MLRAFQYLWAAPNTAIGLVCVSAALLTRGRATVVDGVLEAHGGIVSFVLRRLPIGSNGAAAMTLGHVVIGQDEAMLASTRTHERVHVEQYGRFGPLFLPLYGLSSLHCVCTGKRAYLDNVFEREAYARERDVSLM